MKMYVGDGKCLVQQIEIDGPSDGMNLTIFCLGDRERGFIPSPKMFKEFTKQVKAAVKSAQEGKPPIIISHPFLSVIQLNMPPNGQMILPVVEKKGK